MGSCIGWEQIAVKRIHGRIPTRNTCPSAALEAVCAYPSCLLCASGSLQMLQGFYGFKYVVDRRQESGHDGPAFRGRNAWYMIDFGEMFAVKPSHYSLEHGTISNWYGLMRGWDFQGSNDALEWHTLKSHDQDQSLQYHQKQATFEIEESPNYYRYFRVKITQRQHHGHWEITATLLEIYGDFMEKSICDVNNGDDSNEESNSEIE